MEPNTCQELVPLVKELVANSKIIILWLITISILTCVS